MHTCVHIHADQGKHQKILGHFGTFGTFRHTKVQSSILLVVCRIVIPCQKEEGKSSLPSYIESSPIKWTTFLQIRKIKNQLAERARDLFQTLMCKGGLQILVEKCYVMFFPCCLLSELEGQSETKFCVKTRVALSGPVQQKNYICVLNHIFFLFLQHIFNFRL